MKLSLLDPLVIPRGGGTASGLAAAIRRAQRAEALGFTRYWIVEHHNVAFECDPAPEVFAAAVAAATRTIRIGVGGVLLNHYSPYKAAEALRTLHALHPGRIDVGIGRATAGPLADRALKRLRDAEIPDDHAAQVEEFVGWLGNDLPETSPFRALRIMPDAPPGPTPWILAVTEASARRAGALGLGLACSAFHTPGTAGKAVAAYRGAFTPSRYAAGLPAPTMVIAVRLVLGETQEEAERLAMPMRAIFKLRRQDDVWLDHVPDVEEAIAIMGGVIPASDDDWPDYVIGTPDRVRRTLGRMAALTGAGEFMVQDFIDDPDRQEATMARLAAIFELRPRD